MAYDPLSSISKITRLTGNENIVLTQGNTQTGNGRYSLEQLKKELGNKSLLGSVTPLTKDIEQGVYIASEVGIYPNFGNIEVDQAEIDGGLVLLTKNNDGTFSKDLVPMQGVVLESQINAENGVTGFNPIGKVAEGDLRAVSGDEVFSQVSTRTEFNVFDINDLNQIRASKARSCIYKDLLGKNINYLNIYAPQDGEIKVFIASKNGLKFTILREKKISTKSNVFSYYIGDLDIGDSEYLGVNFISYGFVLQYETEGTFWSIQENISQGETFDFIDRGDFVKISFSNISNDNQLNLLNTRHISNILGNDAVFNSFKNLANDYRSLDKHTFIFDKLITEPTFFEYVKINKPTNTNVLIVNFNKLPNGAFSHRQWKLLTINDKTDTYKIDWNVSANQYIGMYFPNKGYVYDITDENEGYLPVLEANLDPTAGDFTPNKTTNKVKVSFLKDSIGFKVNNIEKYMPLALNEYIKVPNTAKNIVKMGQPIYLPDPYGYNQFLHPNVLYIKDGYLGYKYWMAVTPMPKDGALYADRYENPCVYVSNDAVTWRTFPGHANPLDDLTLEEIENKDYMSDPFLVYREDLNRMECWYRISYAKENLRTLMLRRYTTNGVEWSDREIMLDLNTYHMMRSPIFKWDNSRKVYRAWYQGGPSNSSVCYNESSDGKVWDNFKLCTGISNCWHLDLTIVENEYYLLNYNGDRSAGIEQLILHKSTDGINFDAGQIILEPEVGTWYGDRLYKSTLLFNGKEWIMYFSGETDRRYIGIATGKDPYKLNVKNGGFEVGATYNTSYSALINNKVRNTLLSFGGGNTISYDDNLKVIYITKINGEQIPILKL